MHKKKIKSMVALSLCTALMAQNVMVIANAAEAEQVVTNGVNVTLSNELQTETSENQENQSQTETSENQENQSQTETSENQGNQSQTETSENQGNQSQTEASGNQENQSQTETSENQENTQEETTTVNQNISGAIVLSQIEKANLTNPNAIGCGTVTANALNVRSGPSTSNKILGTLKLGDYVEILGKSNGWYKVELAGETGYIHPAYLQLKSLEKGIDVSKWNGSIDWQKVKNAGIDYVIIRAGYRTASVDPYFKEHIEGAINAGLKVGVYWFSYATSPEMAVKEAQKCIETIAPYKSNISYPVFFDYEQYSIDDRNDKTVEITKDLVSEMAASFIKTINNAGYASGIYTNQNFSKKYINSDLLNSNNVWIARYNTHITFDKAYSMWQYTDKGSVDGVNGNVDMNHTFLKPDMNVVVQQPVQPEVKPEEQPQQPVQPEVKPEEQPQQPTQPEVVLETGVTTANLNLRQGASTSANRITTIPKGKTIEIVDKSISGWYKVKYNGTTGYVSSEYVQIGGATNNGGATTPNQPTQPEVVLETGVTTENLNLRQGASTSTKRITTIPKGKAIEIVDKSISGWYKVKYNGTTGYVSSRYVQIGGATNNNATTTPNQPTQPEVVLETGVTTENLNLRQGASTSTKRITTIPKGKAIEIVDKSISGWYKVKYNGTTGYVSSRYVQIGGATNNNATTTETEQGVTTENLNLRQGASTSTKRITTIPKGKAIEIVDKSISGWYKVKYNGTTGYVSSRYVQIGGATNNNATTTETEQGVTTENLNLRQGASTSTKRITTIPKGKAIEIVDKSISGWYKVKYNGTTGYVSSAYVQIGETVNTTSTSYLTTTDNLNLRKGTSTSSSRITTIKKGTKIEILERTNSSWYKVKYNGHIGYVSSQYVR